MVLEKKSLKIIYKKYNKQAVIKVNTNLGLDELDEKCLKQNNWEVAQNVTATCKKWAKYQQEMFVKHYAPWAPSCQKYLDNWMKYAWTEMTADLSLDAYEAGHLLVIPNLHVKFDDHRSGNCWVITRTSFGLPTDRPTCAKQLYNPSASKGGIIKLDVHWKLILQLMHLVTYKFLLSTI